MGDHIAETIFNLKNIVNSRSDGAVIFHNEEIDAYLPESKKSTNEKSFKRNNFLYLLIMLLFLLIFGSIVGIVCVYQVSQEQLQKHQIKFTEIEKLLHKTGEYSNRENLDGIRKNLKALEHNFITTNDRNEQFGDNITQEVENLKENYSKQMSQLLAETNLTLCTENQGKILVPTSGLFKIRLSLIFKVVMQKI